MGTDGRIKAGRPNLIWLESFENDWKSMGVKRWRKKAEHIYLWVIVLKEALVKLRIRTVRQKKKRPVH